MLPGWVPTAAPWHSAAQALYANLTQPVTAASDLIHSNPTGAKLNKTVLKLQAGDGRGNSAANGFQLFFLSF